MSQSKPPSLGLVLEGKIRSQSRHDKDGWLRREILLEINQEQKYPQAGDLITLIDSDKYQYELNFVHEEHLKGHVCLGKPSKLKGWFQKHYPQTEMGEDRVYCQQVGKPHTYRLYSSQEWNQCLSEEASFFQGLQSLELENFTVFNKVRFDFCPGINVLIGENGVGKTHVLKAIYSVFSAFHEYQLESQRRPELLEFYKNEEKESYVSDKKGNWVLEDKHEPVETGFPKGYWYLVQAFSDIIKDVFLPDHTTIDFVRDLDKKATIKLNTKKLNIDWTFSPNKEGTRLLGFEPHDDPHVWLTIPKALYIPSREVMSIFPGFISTWLKRHSNFDKTYFHLCLALQEAPLRVLPEWVQNLIQDLETVLEGKIELSGDGRFVLKKDEKSINMHMLAEGHRKFAMLAWLLMNGELLERKILFWDEPETNLNPRMVSVLKHILLKLAQNGIQIILATHDYLLGNELSLENEANIPNRIPVKFFSLYKSEQGVQIESESVMSDLEHNPILSEFAAHYEREILLLGGISEK